MSDFDDDDPPKRRKNGQPWGKPYRTRRTKQINVDLSAEELWELKMCSEGGPLNQLSADAMLFLAEADPAFVESEKALELLAACKKVRGRVHPFNSKYTSDERYLWDALVDRYDASRAAVLVWAIRLHELATE